tara:strand:- start:154 stop:855 length:702 start_codon:yes stop_codon:yes gene_type:complete
MATEFKETKWANIFAEGIKIEDLSFKPVILEELKNLDGKKVLDIGCGNGNYTKILAERGALVTGIDFSEKQIELARKINPHENVTYLTLDGGNMPKIEDNSMDFVFMKLVVPSLESKSKLSEVLSEIKRVLKQNGEFIFVILHPLYLLSKHPLDRPISFKEEKYFDEGSNFQSEAITNKGNKMIFEETHFSLTYLTKIMVENKLLIERLIESKAVPEENHYLPIYLIIKGIAL